MGIYILFFEKLEHFEYIILLGIKRFSNFNQNRFIKTIFEIKTNSNAIDI